MERAISNSPSVSVVTVCYNAAADLEKTVRNVLAQEWPGLEFVVIDGGSTDGTAEVLRRYKESVDVIVSEPDRGIYDAMNKGVALASGDYVIFMNAGDCFASADTLSRVFDSVGESRPDVIYGDVVKGGAVKVAGEPHNSHRMFFCHQSCLALRQRLVETPFDISHRMSADFKWVKSMFKQRRRFCKVEVAVADFDTTGVSNSRRSAGLRDNIRVVCEMDSLGDRLKLLPRLIVPYIICRLRGK